MEPNRITRRRFGAVVSAAAASATGVAQQQTPPANSPLPRRNLAPDTLAFEGALEFTFQRVPLHAEPFPMHQVRLSPSSMYRDAYEWNRAYMSRLEADRLLYTFRVKSRLKDVGIYRPRHRWEFSSTVKLRLKP